jgi:hypothetical protein
LPESAAKALSTPPVAVRPFMDAVGRVVVRMRLMTWEEDQVGFWVWSRATTPATWGEAMEVPLSQT